MLCVASVLRTLQMIKSQKSRRQAGGELRTANERETGSVAVAAAAERAIWGVGSTVTTVATLRRAEVDTGSFNAWSFASVGAGPCCVTVRGRG